MGSIKTLQGKNLLSTLKIAPKNLFFISFLVLTLTGCLGPRKINKWVDKHYKEVEPAQKKSPVNYLSVTASLIFPEGPVSITEKKTSDLLPLLFYWQWDYKNTCTLNPKIPIDHFTSETLAYANKKGLKQKLNGQRVELTVDHIPNVFAIDDKGHLIWVVLYAFGWEALSIQPENKDMVVSYRILQGNVETKKGLITIPNVGKPYYLKMFQSLKKKTWQFLDQYDANIAASGKLVIDQLVTDL